MATVHDFTELDIWKLARELAIEIFVLLRENRFKNDFALSNQINAASGSVMDNIAEGFERGGRKEFIQFLSIAKASNAEVLSQLYRAYDRSYINEDEFLHLTRKTMAIKSKIQRFIEYLNVTEIKGKKYK